MKFIQITTFALSLVFLASCSKTVTVVGSGNIITEERPLEPVTNVILMGTGKIETYYSASPELSLTGYANLIPHYITEVSGNTLTVKQEENVALENNNVVVRVGIPKLNDAQIMGTGAIIISDHMNPVAASASIDGSGSIKIQNVYIGRLDLTINGSGDITHSNALCDSLAATINGSGHINMYVNTWLNGTINGSGTITFGGSPTVTSNINGNGSIKPE